jgi:hypothetical protein
MDGRARTLLATSTAPRAARDFLRETLATQNLDGCGEVAELLTTELVTNVVDHVGCAPTVRVHAPEGCIRVEVDDTSTEAPAVQRQDAPSSRGNGMRLVDGLATRWGVEVRPGGKTVWFELDVSAPTQTRQDAPWPGLDGRPRMPLESAMSYAVDFHTVSTTGVESSPVAAALAGLRAHEARYFKNKYDHVFTVEPARSAQEAIQWVHRILEDERDLVIAAQPLEATEFQVANLRVAYVFYESGLEINVMYDLDDAKKRAVGFKLSEGMEVPAELASKFKFATQKSKLAGTIRGSYFVIKGEH